jgi:hypothetical protein
MKASPIHSFFVFAPRDGEKKPVAVCSPGDEQPGFTYGEVPPLSTRGGLAQDINSLSIYHTKDAETRDSIGRRFRPAKRFRISSPTFWRDVVT